MAARLKTGLWNLTLCGLSTGIDERPVFTPWRWRRSRAVTALVAAVLVGYFLSPMPVLYVLWRFNLYGRPAGGIYTISYRPVAYLQETFPAVDQFYGWQLETLFAMTRG